MEQRFEDKTGTHTDDVNRRDASAHQPTRSGAKSPAKTGNDTMDSDTDSDKSNMRANRFNANRSGTSEQINQRGTTSNRGMADSPESENATDIAGEAIDTTAER